MLRTCTGWGDGSLRCTVLALFSVTGAHTYTGLPEPGCMLDAAHHSPWSWWAYGYDGAHWSGGVSGQDVALLRTLQNVPLRPLKMIPGLATQQAACAASPRAACPRCCSLCAGGGAGGKYALLSGRGNARSL